MAMASREGFGIVRGGLYATRSQRSRIELDRRMKARFVRMRGRNGKVPDARFYDVSGKRAVQPWGKMADYLEIARRARVPFQEAKGLVREMDKWVDELYGITPQQDTGEFRPAA